MMLKLLLKLLLLVVVIQLDTFTFVLFFVLLPSVIIIFPWPLFFAIWTLCNLFSIYTLDLDRWCISYRIFEDVVCKIYVVQYFDSCQLWSSHGKQPYLVFSTSKLARLSGAPYRDVL